MLPERLSSRAQDQAHKNSRQFVCLSGEHQQLVDQSHRASVVGQECACKFVPFCAKTAFRDCHVETCRTRAIAGLPDQCLALGPATEKSCLIRRYQKRVDELLLHCVDEGRPPRLRPHACLDTPAHCVPIRVKIPRPAASWPLGWPRLRPVRYPLPGLYQPRGHENSDGPVGCDVVRKMRGRFTPLLKRTEEGQVREGGTRCTARPRSRRASPPAFPATLSG